MARGGKLTRHMDAEAIRAVLHGIYDPDKESVSGVLTPVPDQVEEQEMSGINNDPRGENREAAPEAEGQKAR